MLSAEKAAQAATLAAVRASFNKDIAGPVNLAGKQLQANSAAKSSAELTAVIAAFNATVRALNASGQTLLKAIADTDALVPNDPPVPVPPVPVPVAGLGATNQRTGAHYDGLAGLYVALGAALDGDTILIAPGVYKPFAVGLTKTLVLKSAVPGKRYVFDAGGQGTQNRVIELGMGVGLTIEDAELCNNKTEWGNAAGIWPTGGVYNLIVRRCLFHDLNNGIMVGAHTDGTVLVEDCEAYDNGDWNGYGHNFYIGRVASFIIRRSFVHAVKKRGDPGVANYQISWGHLVKSRAEVTLIEDCRLLMGSGEANRCIDLPNGGDATIRRNKLEYKTPQNGGVGQIISYGVEESTIPQTLKTHRLAITDNTIVNRAGDIAQTIWIAAETPPEVYSVTGNIFAGQNQPSVKGDHKWAIPLTSASANRVVPFTAFKNLDGYDWSLLPEPWRAPASLPIGVLDGISADGIVQGWSIDPDAKTVSNIVQVFIDGPVGTGTLIAGTPAVLRADVNTAYTVSGNHGFAYAVPALYKDGKQHSVYAYGISSIDGNVSSQLRNSPASFTLTGPTPVPIPVPAPDPVPVPVAAWTPARDAAGKITNFAALPARTWMPVPGTSMEATIKPLLDAGGYTLYTAGDSGLGSVMDNYSGMAWDYAGGRGWAYGGGHYGGSDNGVYQIDLKTMRWSITSYPTHPTMDLRPDQLKFYLNGARSTSGRANSPVHVFPLKDSSTGFAVNAAGFSCMWIPVTGPERDIVSTDVAFPNGDTWAKAADHGYESPPGGMYQMFDGRPTTMHTYGGFNYSAAQDMLILVGRIYWGCKLEGSGWIRYPNPGAGIQPMYASGEGLWIQNDEKTGKTIWGGCGSSCWDHGYYFYSRGIIFDPATWKDSPSPQLMPDAVYAPGTSQMLVNAGDLMTFSFKAGRRIGGLCSTGYGWTYDLDTGARQLLFMGGNVYSGNKGEGRSLAYLPHLGQTWVFDTSAASCPTWSIDVDRPKPGGPNGALLVDCQPVALANSGALPSSGNGLTYSRLTFWPTEHLLVYFPTTKADCQVCLIP